MLSIPRGLKAISNPTAKRAAIVLALTIGVLLLVSVASRFFDHLQTARVAAALAADEAMARIIVNRAQGYFKPQEDALTQFAQEPKVVAAITGADEAARTQLATELQARVPSALRLRLLSRGVNQTDSTASPPLTYASLDMLAKAERTVTPPGIEIHLAGTPQEHMVMVRRVPPSGEPVGFLHLSLDAKSVRTGLAKVLGNDAPFELRQPVTGAPPVILVRNDASTAQEEDTVVLGLPGTAWVIAIRRPTAATETETNSTLMDYLPHFTVALLAMIGVAVWRRRKRVAGPADSSVAYQGAIKAIMDGEYPGLEEIVPGLSDASKRLKAAVSKNLTTVAMDANATKVAPAPPANAGPAEPSGPAPIAPVIFRRYDIRGIVGQTLTPDAVYQIGRAFGSEAALRNQATVIVARDGRVSSVALRDALVQGLRESGRNVLDIGLTPTPVLYFATHYLDARSGIMVTGSHNSREYNGLKMVLDGETLSGAAIQGLRQRIDAQDFATGNGGFEETEIIPDYIRRISEEIPVSLGDALKVVVDCGNGVAGIVAPHILRAIGHDVIELFCEIDGEFPNHDPDPSQPHNLEDLIAIVRHEQADLGLAFDGDGDRLGVVDRAGNILWPDRQLMLFAQEILSRNPGTKVIYDVKCSRLLAAVIKAAGGVPMMWKTGHSLLKSKMQETGALLAGDMSGHIFFKDRWYGFDDALYSAARLLEILVNANEPPEQVFGRLPSALSTPELRLEMPEERHTRFMQQVLDTANFPDGEINRIDGLRVDFSDSWGLVRASNTTPCLVLRFEGDTDAALESVQARFRELLLAIDANLSLPF